MFVVSERESLFGSGPPLSQGSGGCRLNTKEDRECEGEEEETNSSNNLDCGPRVSEEADAMALLSLPFCDQCSRETDTSEAPCIEYIKSSVLPTIQQA